jgi:hypothetical protein
MNLLQVTGGDEDLSTLGAECPRQLVQPLPIASMQDHAGPFLRQALGGGRPDPCAAAGYQGAFFGAAKIHGILPVPRKASLEASYLLIVLPTSTHNKVRYYPEV